MLSTNYSNLPDSIVINGFKTIPYDSSGLILERWANNLFVLECFEIR